MSGGLYSRLTVWGADQVLTSAALNAEFDNVLNNFIPQMMLDYSATVAQMQIQTSPGNIGSESLATSLAGELERIRFVLAEIIGEPYWYETPVTSLSQLNSALGAAALQNKIASGQTNGTAGSTQPAFLVPSGSATTVTLTAGTVPFIYSIQGASYTISTNVAVTSLTTAPSSNNTAIVNDTAMSGQPWTKIAGENGSVITLATVGSIITGLVGQIAAFKEQASGEYFIGRVISSVINAVTVYQITECRRGYFYNSSNVPVPRGVISNGDTIQLMKLTWIFANTSLGLAIVYDNPVWGGTAPSSPNIGDYWFDFTVNYWKIYNGTSFVAANATLIGVAIQDTSHTVGARGFDFFEGYSSLNTAELILDQVSSGTVRTRYIGCQVSVYGTVLQLNQGYLNFIAGANNVSGVTVSSGSFYYFYLDQLGNQLIDSVPPYDRRGDLLGFYHPDQTWRCLGYAYANGSNSFSGVESFYRNDLAGNLQTITAAAAADPLPDLIHTSPNYILVDTSGGAYTQFLPPVAQYKGQSITYMKVSTDTNICTLQVFEPVVLSTTGNWTNGTTTTNLITALAATTGLTAGLLVSGLGIPRGTTVVATSGATATLSNPVFGVGSTTAVTFGQTGGIAGNITFPLVSANEFITFFSTGLKWVIKERSYTQDWIPFSATAAASGTLVTSISGSNPSFGTVLSNVPKWRREGSCARIVWDLIVHPGGGTGSDLYTFNVPAEIGTIDLSVTGTHGYPASTAFGYPTAGIATMEGKSSAGTTFPTFIFPVIYSATQVAFTAPYDVASGGGDAGLFYGWGGGSGQIDYVFGTTAGFTGAVHMDVLLPIVGWIG